jgi:hypothetical protein
MPAPSSSHTVARATALLCGGVSQSTARGGVGRSRNRPLKRRLAIGAVTVGEAFQASQTPSILPHVGPELAGFSRVHDRLFDVLHVCPASAAPVSRSL